MELELSITPKTVLLFIVAVLLIAQACGNVAWAFADDGDTASWKKLSMSVCFAFASVVGALLALGVIE